MQCRIIILITMFGQKNKTVARFIPGFLFISGGSKNVKIKTIAIQ
ncbi:MAG: hypothetical protein JWQ84_2348 [Mucilaginibacter sp.]|nr:hypothetical protein [Mucilaginibacter sp.]